MNMEPALSLPLIEQNVNSRVCADGKTVGLTPNALPVVIKLKEFIYFHIKSSIHLKPEVKKWVKSYCTDFS